MLVAYDVKRAALINLLDSPADKLTGTYICPACRATLRLKKGQIKRPHFAHVSLSDCDFESENESSQHLTLKSQLYRWGAQSTDVVLEAYLPRIRQIADLLVNEKLALEVQCSNLSEARLRTRTQAYHDAGYQVLWLLGRELWLDKRLRPLHKQLLYFSQNMGFHLWELDATHEVLRLKYLIHEDMRGQVQYLTRTFQMGQGELLQILRTPFARQSLPSFKGRLLSNPAHFVQNQLAFRHPGWMQWQAQRYEKGEGQHGLEDADFYPQIRPVTSQCGFAQINQALDAYYENFAAFYQKEKNKGQQSLYPPAFYML